MSAGFSKAEGEYKTGTCQLLHPQRISQQASAPLANTLRLANESLSHEVQAYFKWLLLPWDLGWVTACTSPLGGVSQFITALWFSWKRAPLVSCFRGLLVGCMS